MSYQTDLSVEKDRCIVCNADCERHGRHSISYPLVYQGGLVCDDCLMVFNVVCECCNAGRTMDELISHWSSSPKA